MVKRSRGIRSKSRHILRKKPRERGISSITRALAQYEIGENVNVKFTKNWQRVQQFGQEGIQFLKDFVKQMSAFAGSQPYLSGLLEDQKLNETRLRQIISTWNRSIQFSSPRASTENAKELLVFLEKQFLSFVGPESLVEYYKHKTMFLTEIKRDLQKNHLLLTKTKKGFEYTPKIDIGKCRKKKPSQTATG